jgi:hypothetical protein
MSLSPESFLSQEEIMIPYPLFHSVLAIWLGLVSLPVLASPAADDPDPQHITKLIAQLGSSDFQEREEATRALKAVGAPALAALRQAAKSPDPEVRQRADGLAQQITQQMESTKLLTPVRIELKFQNTPVDQAVRDLAKQSGYSISLAAGKGKPASRRVTLSTGETTFWEAFDQFCRMAGLVEESPGAQKGAMGLNGPVPPGFPGPGGGPLPIPGKVPPGIPGPGGGPPPVPGQFPPPGLPPGGGALPLPGAIPVLLDAGTGKLILVDGKPPLLPTCYAGAMRIRALPDSTKSDGIIQLTLEVTPEPRMQWRNPGSAHIDKAVDNRDRKLTQAAAPAAGPGMPGLGFRSANTRQFTVRLQMADESSKTLKLLKGTVAGDVQIPLGELVEVKNILQAAGKTFQGKERTSLEVLQASRQKDGAIRVQVKLTTPADIVPLMTDQDKPPFPGQIPPGLGRPQPLRGIPLPNMTGLALLDEKGRSVPLVDKDCAENKTGDAVIREATLTFQPKKGQGNPVKLRFTGARTAAIAVPFTLKDVPLP